MQVYTCEIRKKLVVFHHTKCLFTIERLIVIVYEVLPAGLQLAHLAQAELFVGYLTALSGLQL